MTAFLPNLVLLQYACCAVVSIVGLLMLSKVLWAVLVRKSETRLSAHLVLHCCSWLCFMLTILPLVVYTLSFWKGRATLYHSNWMFWTGVFNMVTSSVISVVTFFMLADRCLLVGFPDAYSYKWKRVGVGVCIFCTVLAWVIVFLVMSSEGPFPKMTRESEKVLRLGRVQHLKLKFDIKNMKGFKFKLKTFRFKKLLIF